MKFPEEVNSVPIGDIMWYMDVMSPLHTFRFPELPPCELSQKGMFDCRFLSALERQPFPFVTKFS